MGNSEYNENKYKQYTFYVVKHSDLDKKLQSVTPYKRSDLVRRLLRKEFNMGTSSAI